MIEDDDKKNNYKTLNVIIISFISSLCRCLSPVNSNLLSIQLVGGNSNRGGTMLDDKE
jgi:hypothetical protein